MNDAGVASVASTPVLGADPIQLATAVARGRRPEFTGDPMVERVLSMTVALTTELAVTRERLDTVERTLPRRALLPREDVETYVPDRDARAERALLHDDYLSRVFRILLQDPGTAGPTAVNADPVKGARDGAAFDDTGAARTSR
jgi:hypothetical protein